MFRPKQPSDFGVPIDFGGALPVLAPPPVTGLQDSSPRFNPFDKSREVPAQLTDNIFAQGPCKIDVVVDRMANTSRNIIRVFD